MWVGGWTDSRTWGQQPFSSFNYCHPSVLISMEAFRVKEKVLQKPSPSITRFFGLCGVAHMMLRKEESAKYLNINLLFGVGVTLGIQAAGSISGAHMNASITFTHCVLGRLPWRKLPVYIIGQFLGSFVAAARLTPHLLFLLAALCEHSGGKFIVTGPNGTAGIFATYPAPYMSLLGGFLDEVSAQGFPATALLAVLIGILVLVSGMAMETEAGYPINPSRDLPPRILTAIAGWGIQVFRAGDNWWWVPLVAPTLGSLLGVLVYKLLIGFPNQIAVEGGEDFLILRPPGNFTAIHISLFCCFSCHIQLARRMSVRTAEDIRDNSPLTSHILVLTIRLN
uniref:Uncharacterized protein n=1 Tax=Pelusios castaneus TaxID=367368 RepID=A0A8C8RDM1_9SAUR